MEKLKAEMEGERAKSLTGYLPAAFVTFNDRYSQTVAASGMHSHDEGAWRVRGAPGPDEIIWKNLRMRHWQRVLRTLGMAGLFVAILVLYLPLTAALQVVVNLDNAAKVPGLSIITRLPFVTQVIQGILPGLGALCAVCCVVVVRECGWEGAREVSFFRVCRAETHEFLLGCPNHPPIRPPTHPRMPTTQTQTVLKIFLIVLPPILNAMARFAGKVSTYEVDFSTVSNFFIFQVFATFLYQLIAGTALSNLAPLAADPKVRAFFVLRCVLWVCARFARDARTPACVWCVRAQHTRNTQHTNNPITTHQPRRRRSRCSASARRSRRRSSCRSS